jgi:hypothetical protein
LLLLFVLVSAPSFVVMPKPRMPFDVVVPTSSTSSMRYSVLVAIAIVDVKPVVPDGA